MIAGILVGMVVGVPVGWFTARFYTTFWWRVERTARLRAQGRRDRR